MQFSLWRLSSWIGHVPLSRKLIRRRGFYSGGILVIFRDIWHCIRSVETSTPFRLYVRSIVYYLKVRSWIFHKTQVVEIYVHFNLKFNLHFNLKFYLRFKPCLWNLIHASNLKI